MGHSVTKNTFKNSYRVLPLSITRCKIRSIQFQLIEEMMCQLVVCTAAVLMDVSSYSSNEPELSVKENYTDETIVWS